MKTHTRRVINHRGQSCYLCGALKDPGDLTADHVIPRSKGGTSELINLYPCCFECNQDKADLDLEEYRAKVHWRTLRIMDKAHLRWLVIMGAPPLRLHFHAEVQD